MLHLSHKGTKKLVVQYLRPEMISQYGHTLQQIKIRLPIPIQIP
jgi:hypothetical protein